LQITEGAVSTSVGAAAPTTVDTLLQHQDVFRDVRWGVKSTTVAMEFF
jgi:ribosome maturation protein Sdo1